MVPPRMKAGGQSYVQEILSGWPRRGGTAGTTSVARYGLRRSTVTRSCRPPSSRVKTLGPRASARYGLSYNGESGGPGAPHLMNTKSAEERAGGGVDAGGGPPRVWWVDSLAADVDSPRNWRPVAQWCPEVPLVGPMVNRRVIQLLRRCDPPSEWPSGREESTGHVTATLCRPAWLGRHLLAAGETALPSH